MIGEIDQAWLELLLGFTGIGGLFAVVTALLRSAVGGLK